MKKVAYWITTAIIALVIGAGGVVDAMLLDQAKEGLIHLGYPLYFGHALGVWKVAGAIALLVPGVPRIKEWAYFGIFIDLSMAAYSHASVGDPMQNVLGPVVFTGILAASYLLRPESRRLA